MAFNLSGLLHDDPDLAAAEGAGHPAANGVGTASKPPLPISTETPPEHQRHDRPSPSGSDVQAAQSIATCVGSAGSSLTGRTIP